MFPHISISLSPIPSFLAFVVNLSAEFGRVFDALTYLDRSYPASESDGQKLIGRITSLIRKWVTKMHLHAIQAAYIFLAVLVCYIIAVFCRYLLAFSR